MPSKYTIYFIGHWTSQLPCAYPDCRTKQVVKIVNNANTDILKTVVLIKLEDYVIMTMIAQPRLHCYPEAVILAKKNMATVERLKLLISMCTYRRF